MDQAGLLPFDHHRNKSARTRTAVTLGDHGSGSVKPLGGPVKCGSDGEWVVILRGPSCQVQFEEGVQNSTNAHHMVTRVAFSETLGVGANVGVIISPNRAEKIDL